MALLDFDKKHPIILPQSRVVALFIRQEHIRLKHAGLAALITVLRTRFWIVGVRRLVHKIRSRCVSCLRQDTAVKASPPPSLPTDRIHPSAPFSVSVLDHAGPLYCTDAGDSKKYILLFTCAVVRAVHLELTDSLNFDDTALAIRRFAARHVIPSVFYSDNARTFRSMHP